jgi:RNA polymerase sigma-70 factor, ECF subfamily
MEPTTPSTAATQAPSELQEKLADLWELTADAKLHRLSEGHTPEGHEPPQSEQEYHDLVSSCLMDCYRNTGEPRVFAMLFDLNQASFLQAIQAKVRRSAGQVDPQDVLQEVFLNIYRYPRRFLCERADSFRNWGHRIVRNTMLKFFKAETRLQRFTPLDEDVGQRADPQDRSPYRAALEGESAKLVDFAYLVYLNLYLVHYKRLSAKEQRALQMVEVDGASYKETAASLGIRLENLKMVIFRGRRKIFRGLQKSLLGFASPPPQHATLHN